MEENLRIMKQFTRKVVHVHGIKTDEKNAK